MDDSLTELAPIHILEEISNIQKRHNAIYGGFADDTSSSQARPENVFYCEVKTKKESMKSTDKSNSLSYALDHAVYEIFTQAEED